MKSSGFGIAIVFVLAITAFGGMVLVNSSWAQPTAITGPPPAPPNIGTFVKDTNAAIQLGKALFWDMQLGSDGIQACASCHFHAGADNRAKNQLSPGGPNTADTSYQSGGANLELALGHFPIPIGSNDVVSSQGVFNRSFSTVIPGNPVDVCGSTPDPHGFAVGGINVRKVPPRNTPSAVNAAFFFHNFWDGRADNTFNGANPRGPEGAANAHIFQTQTPGGVATEVPVAITNGSLASQAVGPPLSDFEMSCAGRTFPDIGVKMLSLPTPLAKQKVHPDDSVLGPIAKSRTNPLAKGLSVSYPQLIQQAFVDSWWDSAQPVTVGGRTFTQMQANFSLFSGWQFNSTRPR
jgi:hypothetical protein